MTRVAFDTREVRYKAVSYTHLTPDWIVKYMVENSLGRLWLEGHPNGELRQGWRYYLDEAEQEQEVEAQLVQLLSLIHI